MFHFFLLQSLQHLPVTSLLTRSIWIADLRSEWPDEVLRWIPRATKDPYSWQMTRLTDYTLPSLTDWRYLCSKQCTTDCWRTPRLNNLPELTKQILLEVVLSFLTLVDQHQVDPVNITKIGHLNPTANVLVSLDLSLPNRDGAPSPHIHPLGAFGPQRAPTL